MVTPKIGTVVLIPFPFSDLSSSKLRPAVLLADVGKGDWILCQVTSKPYADLCAISISDNDFLEGSLQRTSFARVGKLFTANEGLFLRSVGQLKQGKLRQIIRAVKDILDGK